MVIVTAHAHDGEGEKDFQTIFEGKSFLGPNFYLEKPIDEEKYVRMVCENVGVEYKEPEKEERAHKQRSEIEGLLKDADSDTLSEILKRLKEKG